jgi:hypothetical protein
MLPILGDHISMERDREPPGNTQVEVIVADRIDGCVKPMDVFEHGTPIYDVSRTSNVISS